MYKIRRMVNMMRIMKTYSSKRSSVRLKGCLGKRNGNRLETELNSAPRVMGDR